MGDANVASDCPRTFPVVEIFGPTIQGEGPDAGKPCKFVRFGGCDLRCSWCDSTHAVEPALVRRAEKITAREIASRLGEGKLVVLSGGNPALHELGGLVKMLQHLGKEVAVETQGTIWKSWLADVDRLVVSPKPPSAGVECKTRSFFSRLGGHRGGALKFVIFDETDLDWVRDHRFEYPPWPLYLSVGSPIGMSDSLTRDEIRHRYAWLASAVAKDSTLWDATVLPQLHVIAWGTEIGR